jgi:CHAT domain-containing protein
MSKGFGQQNKPQNKKQQQQIYRKFVEDLYKVVSENKLDKAKKLLLKNVDKIDDLFAETLIKYASRLIDENLESKKQSILDRVGLLTQLIQYLTIGSIPNNIEISIKCLNFIIAQCEVDDTIWAIAQNNLGSAYFYRIKGERKDNLELAITCYENSLQLLPREAFPQQWAMIQNNLAAAYHERIKGERKDNLERVITYAKNCLQVYTCVAFPQQWAMIQNHLGNAYFFRIKGERKDNLETAITYYQNSLQVYTPKTFPEKWAGTQNNLGSAYFFRIKGERKDNLETAITCYQNALQIYTRKTFPEKWAETQNNLGGAYHKRIKGERKDNLETAITYYQNALQVRTREAFPFDWAGTQHNLASAYSDRIKGKRKDNLETAITCYESSLEVYTREAFPYEWAQTQNNLANAYFYKIKGERKDNLETVIDYFYRIKGERKDNLETAIACYENSLQVYTYEAFPYEWANTQNNLAIAYNDRIEGERKDNLETAIACYENSLQVYTRDAFPEQWAITQNNLAIAYLDRIEGKREENLEIAIACYRNALSIRQPQSSPLDCLQTARQLGNLGYKEGNWNIAIEGYSLAIEAIEITRSWAKTDQRRQEILAESLDVYRNMVQVCINAGELEKAIETVERSRSKYLVDLMASNDLYNDGKIPPEVESLLQKYQKKQNQIDLEQSLLKNNSNNEKKLDRISFDRSNETIEELNKEKQKIWLEIRKFDPVLAGEIKVDPLPFSAMQKLIKSPDTAILSFYTTKTDTHIFIIKQPSPPAPLPQGEGCNGIYLYTCEGEGLDNLQNWLSENWLQTYINNYQNWLYNINNILTKLSQKLKLNQLIDQHLNDIQELIIIPHLTLHLIPFSALPIAEGKYLGDRFLIRYTPSSQILQFCDDRKPIETNLNYGTVEDATNDLPCASFEGDQIANLYNIPAQFRLQGKANATCENYRELIEKVNIIHSCHHAEFNLNDPLNSALKLSDGNITLGQLMSPSWRFDKTLSDVFLSCCETGLGTPEITDDILTLSAGFLCAGARSVISTLWAVNDLATALFSLFYYQFRNEEKTRPEALKLAQIKLRNMTKDELNDFAKPINLKYKEAKNNKKQFEPNSDDYLIWDQEYKKYANLYNQILNFKHLDYPFAHHQYWAGFICHGLQ